MAIISRNRGEESEKKNAEKKVKKVKISVDEVGYTC